MLTIDDAAEHFRVTRSTVYRLVRNGDLKAVRIGERLRFHPDDIAAYLGREAAP